MAALILALDTSTFVGTVAVLDGDRVLAEASEPVKTHSERLLPLVERALAEAGVALADVEAVACGRGPGSFTGLRIGMATAKGLCWATGKPIVAVSSLAALAMNAVGAATDVPPALSRGDNPLLVVPVIDAKKREVFVGFYRLGGDGAPASARPETVMRPDRLRAALAGEDAVLLGDGALAYPDACAGLRVLAGRHDLRAANVGRLAHARLVRGQRDDLAAVEPTYMRVPDAEMGRAR